jgi:hypothetical protein
VSVLKLVQTLPQIRFLVMHVCNLRPQLPQLVLHDLLQIVTKITYVSDVSLADGLTRCQYTSIIAAMGVSNWAVLDSLYDVAPQRS